MFIGSSSRCQVRTQSLLLYLYKMENFTLLGILLLVGLSASQDANDSLIVTTKSGSVLGHFTQNDAGETVREFLGIPFAKPPIGENRFRKPEPADSWEGVYNASEISAPCVQETFGYPLDKNISEDCLYLNVWTPVPERTSIELKPVMVFFHGGGFTVGSTVPKSYGGSVLAPAGDVIVVNLNYRLGVLGFLNTNTPDANGNMGIYDQILALKWVKDNIESFGGNSSSVTIFGMSAGSISVNIHLLSPKSAGLFQRGIMESGTVNSPICMESATNSMDRGNRLAKVLSCSSEDSNLFNNPEDTLACLRKVDIHEIVQAQNKISPTWETSFFPTYESDLLPHSPLVASGRKSFHEADIMVGICKNEGSFFLVTGIGPGGRNEIPDVNTTEQAIDHTFDMLEIWGATTPNDDDKLDIYFKDTEDFNKTELLKRISDVVGDSMFLCPSVYFANDFSKTKNNLYFYLFNYRSAVSKKPEWKGVTHVTEFIYVMGLPFMYPDIYDDLDRSFSREMMKIWSTFAATGKPPVINDLTWPQYTNEQKYMELHPSESAIKSRPREKYCHYWSKYLARTFDCRNY